MSGTDATSPNNGGRLNNNPTRRRNWGRKIMKSVDSIIMRPELKGKGKFRSG
jgi:hypothetical protein